jgi:hypothetical protein
MGPLSNDIRAPFATQSTVPSLIELLGPDCGGDDGADTGTELPDMEGVIAEPQLPQNFAFSVTLFPHDEHRKVSSGIFDVG